MRHASILLLLILGQSKAFGRTPRSWTALQAIPNISGGEIATPAPPQVDSRTPVTLLTGFLGAGKTTLLKHLLENKEGLKIALVVNDVADVNIDAKLVRPSEQSPDADPNLDMVELQNGCACCSLADELFGALSQLQQLARLRGFEYDHFVIEASGVAEPVKIRERFQEAEDFGVGIFSELRLDTLVTVVDTAAFPTYYASKQRLGDRDDLGLPSQETQMPGMMLDDLPYHRAVVDLLVEQAEVADVILLNKADLADEKARKLTREILETLNPSATIIECTYGQVPLQAVLGAAEGMHAAHRGSIDDHKEAVAQASALPSATADSTSTAESHSHDHAHAAVAAEPECSDSDSKDGHSHSHSHSHGESHSHSEDHATTEGHSHSHSHDSSCADPECTDTSHSHSHDHQETTAAERFGIRSVVYRARRPFHPQRLLAVFQCLQGGAAVLKVITGEGNAGAEEPKPSEVNSEGAVRDPHVVKSFSGIMRSKGFLWLASADKVAYYWSHAGAFAEIGVMGRWWAAVPEHQWPEGFSSTIREDFDDASGRGDRRQELVLIGTGLENHDVSKIMDSALLTDEELELYDSILGSGEDARVVYKQLEKAFPNPFE